MNKIPFFIFSLLIMTACSSDDDNPILVNLEEFEPITKTSPYKDLVPGVENYYWELVYQLEDQDPMVVAQAGEKCKNATDKDACEQAFDGFTTDRGFAGGCLPSYCFLYLKYQGAQGTSVVNVPTALHDFLGAIDSKADALLWARTNGYHWSTDTLEAGAIKETENGYELLVTKVVKFCEPLQIDRYHIAIDREGKISILQEEVYQYDANACA